MRGIFATGLLVACLWLAGAAQAATVQVRTEALSDNRGPVLTPHISFLADVGEHNSVVTSADYTSLDGTSVVIMDRVPMSPGPGCEALSGDQRRVRCLLPGLLPGNPQTAALDRSDLSALRIDLGDEPDSITINSPLPTAVGASIDGGPGTDNIKTVSLQYAEVSGGTGNDRIVMFGSVDECGGAGGGRVDEGATPNGSDTITGGDLITVDYGRRTTPVALSSDGRANDGAAGERDDIGTGADTLVGGAARDVLRGGKQADLLLGGPGADTLRGGSGNDQLRAGGGTSKPPEVSGEQLDGGPGNDRLTGSPAADSLRGGPGFDTLRGGDGPDLLDGRDGQSDTLDCGPGEDRVKADDRDFTFVGRRFCERTGRPKRATAVELGGDTSPVATGDTGSQDGVRVALGCPADGPKRCRGRLSLPGRPRALARAVRFSIKRGQIRSISLAPSTRLRKLIATGDGARVRPALTTRRSGRTLKLRLQPRLVSFFLEEGDGCN